MKEYIVLTKKICINPTLDQINKINTIFNLERLIWNKYIEVNQKRYKEGKSFISAITFDTILRYYKNRKIGFEFLNDIPKYPRQDILRRCEKAYKKFFRWIKNSNKNIQVNLPKFKSKKRNPITYYFFEGNDQRVKYNYNSLYIRFIDSENINLPYLGKVELKQKNYLLEEDLPNILESCIKYEKNKFYVCLYIKYPINHFYMNPTGCNLGIDVGISNYMTIYNGLYIINIPNINESKIIKRLEERIEILNQKASRKMELNRKKFGYKYANYRCISNNVSKIYSQISKLYTRIKNIKNDYMKKIVHDILVIIKPRYITIENLSVKKMIENGHGDLVKHLQDTGLGKLLRYLSNKAAIYGVEIRVADKYYASSKICSRCGNKKKDLKLEDRIYHCDNCGLTIDRDVNASVNLYYTSNYNNFNIHTIFK